MKVLVSGSHGLIGTALVTALERDRHEVVRLVRGAAGPGEVGSGPVPGSLDRGALERAELDAVVNLAGESIFRRRWSTAGKARVLSSRVDGTALLAEALAGLPTPPAVMVSGSAVGYYGDRGAEELAEDSGPGGGFLAEVCQAWESATSPAADAGIRVVTLRTGIVQARSGGALHAQLPVFRLGLGGRVGAGTQYMSWITLEDEVGAIRHALSEESLHGPVNATAPGAVTNGEFTATLARVVRRPAFARVPSVALSVALGAEKAREMLLFSQRARPERLLATGYRFAYPELEPALRHILA
jgi:uncharacterized protein